MAKKQTKVNSRFRRIVREEWKHLQGRTPAQDWIKPTNVALCGSSEPLTLRDLTYRYRVDSEELEFELYQRIEEPPRDMVVRPGPALFDQFLGLAEAPAHQIHQFAVRFGPLRVFCKVKGFRRHRLLVVEKCEVWRYIAASIQSLLHIAGCFHFDRRPERSDWERIGMPPPCLVPSKQQRFDLLSPVSWSGEEGFVAMTHFVSRGSDRDRQMWTRLLNSLLELGRVRPWMVWEGSGSSARPKLVFSGPNLLSYLTLELCLRASKQDAFAVCSYCNCEYNPTSRAPRSGQQNFCDACRSDGVPVKLAQRARRERLRAAQLESGKTRR